MGKKVQDPIYMTQEEYDKMRADGYDKVGPRKDSDAANRQKGIGNVKKGDEFGEDQRKGMLADVKPVEKETSWWGTASEGAGAVGVAVGVGALLFGGYQAYKYLTSEDQGSSQTSTSKSRDNRKK